MDNVDRSAIDMSALYYLDINCGHNVDRSTDL